MVLQSDGLLKSVQDQRACLELAIKHILAPLAKDQQAQSLQRPNQRTVHFPQQESRK